MESTNQGGRGGVIWIRGSVSIEPREGEFAAVEGALIKTSQGALAYTDEKGAFTCPVCAPGGQYALCAFKQGFEPWVDWRKLDKEGPGNEWDILLSLEPAGAARELAMKMLPPGPGCIQPKVIDCATRKPIPYAWVRLGSQSWIQTDSTGNNKCLCAPTSSPQLCARKLPHYPMKCKPVNLVLGETIVPLDPTDPNDPAVICLDYV